MILMTVWLAATQSMDIGDMDPCRPDEPLDHAKTINAMRCKPGE